MTRSRIIATLAALCAAGLFGASAPFAKILLGDIDPIPLAALLYFGSGLSAAASRFGLRWGGKGAAQETGLSRADLPWLAGAILSGGVAAPILLLIGLKNTPASTGALLLNFETVATTLIAAVAFREATGRRIWWAVGLVTIASILLSWNGNAEWGFSMGALAILGACTLWGVDNNFTRNIAAKDPLAIVIVKGFGAGLFSTLLSQAAGQSFPGLNAILLALLLGALSYGISITLFILAMRGLGAARTSALFGSAPFVGALIAFLLLREPFSAVFLPALALMAAGGWLLFSEQHEHGHIHIAFEHDHSHSHADEHHLHDHPGREGLQGDSHAHLHQHAETNHNHPHLPDTHHRHEH